MSPLYCAGSSGCIWFFTQDSETFAVTEFSELELWRTEAYYVEDIAALRQLLQDEYGSSDSDGQMFEVVGVPDDVANAGAAPCEETVIITGDDAQAKALEEAFLAIGAKKIR